MSPLLMGMGDMWDQLPVGMVLVSRSYKVQQFNSAAQRLLNIQRAALGEDIVRLVDVDLRVPLRAAINATLTEAAVSPVEEIVVTTATAAGQRYLRITCVPSTGTTEGTTDQVAEAAVLLVTDITAAIHARQALDEASARQHSDSARSDSVRLETSLRQVMEGNRQLRLVNESLTEANRAMLDKRAEGADQTAQAQAETEEAITAEEELQATMEELEILNEELQATVEELEILNEELQATKEELEVTSVGRGPGSKDQRKIAAIQEVEQIPLAAVLASMDDAVAVVDREGRAIQTNVAYDALSSGDLMICDEHNLSLTPDELPQARAARGETFTQQLTLVQLDGTRRWATAVGKPLHGGTAGQTLLVIRDITAISLQRRLQEEFIALAAHELRTPLTAMQGYLDLLVRPSAGGHSTETLSRYIAVAYHQARRLGVLIHDLVDVARLQTGKLTINRTTLDLVPLVTQAVETLSGLHGPDNTPVLSVRAETPAPLWVRGDALRLEQVVLNLVSNALTHARTATRITVDIRQANGGALLSVEDNGAGIPAEALGHIFTQFYQVEQSDYSAHGGMGLGLFICQELVAAHNGSITAESTVGEGTRFTVWLPLLDSTHTIDGVSPGDVA